METNMGALVALALGFGSIVAATSAMATVYVPGMLKDGVYIRPHFLDGPGEVPIVPMLLPPDLEAAKAREAQGPITIEPEAVLPKRRLPAS
jgi:hypothetical protein